MPNHALDYDLDSVLPFAQVEQEKKINKVWPLLGFRLRDKLTSAGRRRSRCG